MACHGCGKVREIPRGEYPYNLTNQRPPISPAGGDVAAAPSAGDSTTAASSEPEGSGR